MGVPKKVEEEVVSEKPISVKPNEVPAGKLAFSSQDGLESKERTAYFGKFAISTYKLEDVYNRIPLQAILAYLPDLDRSIMYVFLAVFFYYSQVLSSRIEMGSPRYSIAADEEMLVIFEFMKFFLMIYLYSTRLFQILDYEIDLIKIGCVLEDVYHRTSFEDVLRIPDRLDRKVEARLDALLDYLKTTRLGKLLL